MSPHRLSVVAFSLCLASLPGIAHSQASAPPLPPYPVGNPLGLPVTPGGDPAFRPTSPNVKVFGSVYSAESCSYDPDRGVIVVPNRGVSQSVRQNDAWITLLNHDGSVHTSRWIGVQNSGPQRDSLSPRLVLNDPFGSDIVNGVLYLADRDGGTAPGVDITNVVRRFSMKTGAPLGDWYAKEAGVFNDIAVATDGTLYGTVTFAGQVWRITPDGQASMLISGAPLNRPNGIALDRQGNIVVVNFANDSVLRFSREGSLLRTERAAQPGSDGLVILRDGTKYVSSVSMGGISRIRPGRPAELIAQNIPTAASMCYDEGAKQLVVPMNESNGLAFIRIR